MNRARTGRAEVHRRDVLLGADRDGNREVAKDVGPIRFERVRLIECDDHIGGPEAPFSLEFRFSAGPIRLPARHPRVHPLRDRADLVVAQPSRSDEGSAVSGDGLPRRHVSARRRFGNRAAAAPDLVEVLQGERRNVPGTMAAEALAPQDGLDVGGVRRRHGLCAGRRGPSQPDRGADRNPDGRLGAHAIGRTTVVTSCGRSFCAR